MAVHAQLANVVGEVVRVPVEVLRLYAQNPRRGDVEAIKESLRCNGQYTPLTVNARSGDVLKGNHTLRAARELGWSEIDVYVVDVADEVARRIVLVDNRTSDLATYDLEALVDLLGSVDELAGTGYGLDDLDELLDELAAAEPLDDDEPMPLPADPVTENGELVELGEHRLLCADATDLAALARVMDGAAADLLLTDPPYGVGYTGKTRQRLQIRNDTTDQLDGLLKPVFENVDAVLGAGGPVYVFHPAGPATATFIDAFGSVGWQLRQGLVWVKDTIVLGRSDYHYQHEPILYGHKPGGGPRGRGTGGWYGDDAQSSVLRYPRPRVSREHPTAKPPELIATLLRNSSRRGQIVLDPFAGSGSTLAACEQLGRRARLIEIDPRYCDVIIDRYQRLTGNRVNRGR